MWSEVAISHESVGKTNSPATAGRLRRSRVGFDRNRWFGRIDWARGLLGLVLKTMEDALKGLLVLE